MRHLERQRVGHSSVAINAHQKNRVVLGNFVDVLTCGELASRPQCFVPAGSCDPLPRLRGTQPFANTIFEFLD